MFREVFLLCAALLSLVNCQSQRFETPVPCVWTDPGTGKIYDLSPLSGKGNSNGDYYLPKGPGQGWDIWLQVCAQLATPTCGNNIAGCQSWSASGKASIGAANSLQFQPAAGLNPGQYGVTIEFTQGDLDRRMEIDFVCDSGAGNGMPAFSGESPTHHYNFKWTSAMSCPVSGSGGLSGGSILLIIFAGLLVIYVVAGVLFNILKRHATGVEIIPNVELWISIPGLVKDGVMYLVHKTIRRGDSYTHV